MGLKARQMMRLGVLLLISVAVADDEVLDGCKKSCGGVSVPYPFGIGTSSVTGENCFLENPLNLTCKNSTLYQGNVQILNISLDGKMEMMFFVSNVCKNDALANISTKGNRATLSTPAFTISSDENKFITVGCDTFGLLDSYSNDTKTEMGCLTRCESKESVESMQRDGKCTGIGCCQMDIPHRMKNISIQAFTYSNFNSTSDFNKCGYSFVAKNGNYSFSMDHLISPPFNSAPMVVRWTVGNQTCVHSKGKACMNNSECVVPNSKYGYRCKCLEGYEGNPYHPHGCKDIDECKRDNHTCKSQQNCRNTDGSHECFCPKGQSGNGTKEEGCHKEDIINKVVLGAGAGIVILFMGTTSLYLIYQKRKLNKHRERYFQQNGGSILLKKLSTRESSSQIEIFTEEQLNKATNKFDESLIIGKGGFGTVFKGHLADNKVVAIKKSKIIDTSQSEQFANEVIILSQINHRNVVKLLGCCLETEVPLLVYEFVNNGTLFEFIHNERKVNDATWKTRLRIAAEAAGALSYLHSEASVPIIHRDVKTANILLDKTYTAKVSDFGASRLVPLDQTEIATMVQGTFGYLDPEYMRTSQLTEKSDVYSFGVVLVELLTGEKPYSYGKPEEKRSLTNHFLSCLKEERLVDIVQVGIMNEENKKEIVEVAIIAARCLRLNGEERPTMKEVAMELDGMRLIEKHPWMNTFENPEKDHLLQQGSSSVSDTVDSSIQQYTGEYDSVNDHVQVAFDDGR